MRITLISLVFILNVFTHINAIEKIDTATKQIDSIKPYSKFEFRSPYIGWEIFGPSNIMALTYQQQFMQLGKSSYLDLQLLINNRNILMERITKWDPKYEQYNYRTHKFAVYLIQRNTLYKRLSLSIGLGYLHYQEYRYSIETEGYDNHISNIYQRNEQNDFVIFKGTFSVNVNKNFMLNININHIFDNQKAFIPYNDPKDNNCSLTLLFGFNKKNEANENPYGFLKNQLFFNLTKMQLGYERFLLNRNDYNVSASIATTAIPYKRYGKYSNKYGWFTLSDAMVNFNYSLNAKMNSFVGAGMFLNYITYYVLSNQYEMQTYGFRSNIGLGLKLNKHMALKLAYTPYITKDININIENMDNFVFLRQYKLNLLLSYSFGK